MRRIAATALVAIVLLALPVGAMAAPQEGACPGKYEPATYAQMAEIFPELLEAFGAAGFEAGLVGFDNNSNGIVCWKPFPSVARVYDKFLFHALVIDDAAVGLRDR